MPCAARSAHSPRVSMTMPPLLAEYGVMPGRANWLWTEPMFTILPWPALIMLGATCWAMRKGAVRLIATISSHSSTGNSTRECRRWMPALLTRMSTEPSVATTSATPARIAAASVMANGTACPEAPVSSASAVAASLQRAGSIPWRTTSHPARARPLASARPMPRLDPVTKAVRPLMSKGWSAVMLQWSPHTRCPTPASPSRIRVRRPLRGGRRAQRQAGWRGAPSRSWRRGHARIAHSTAAGVWPARFRSDGAGAMGLFEGYGRFVTGDLVLTRGSEGAPAPPDVEALYRDASRDAPLCEPPEVATMFARLYGALLARRDVLTVSLREAGWLVGFAYGHPWHWQEQSDPWGAQLRERLGKAADLLEDSLAVYLLAVDPARRRQGLGAALLDALLAEIGKPAWLVTRDEPTPAQALYEQGGWRPVGHGPDAPNGRPGLVLLHD